MAIIETKDNRFKLLRCNNTYRVFMEKMKGDFPLGLWISYEEGCERVSRSALNAVRECAESGKKLVMNDELPDGAVVHSFCKRIAVNHVNNTKAVAMAIMAITDPKNAHFTYSHIAKALSADFVGIYYVNLKNGKFIEYSSAALADELEVERHGTDFFGSSRREARKRLYSEDLELFLDSFTEGNILCQIDSQGAYTLSYRLLINGEPKYVSLKAVRVKSNENNIIVGVSA